MPFDPKLVEANLALHRISAEDLPALAWDALEAGFDGPATRRLAALVSPNFFAVEKILPAAMQEWGIAAISIGTAAIRLAQKRAKEILESWDDPLKHTRDFEILFIDSDYCRELAECGAFDDEIYIAQTLAHNMDEIRQRMKEELKVLANL